MSEEVLLRGFFSLLWALGISWLVFSRYDEEIGTEQANERSPRYQPYVPSVLPLMIPLLFVLLSLSDGPGSGMKMLLSECFSIFLQISLYYLLLVPILPLLRRFISARTCAMLWLMPNYLYILFYGHMELPSPALVITLPGRTAQWLLLLWSMGFAAVMLWKIIGHLRFRRRILRDAQPVTDADVLDLWTELLKEANFLKPKFRLVHSPAVSTPLTIGLYKRSTRVVLPEKKYSPEDLRLILQHEIIHIGREDAWAKFFMVFCTAMCWFNPLMWIAMHRSAEDLELSCDETVLLDADDTARKQYAVLLLDTAGDDRGFSTCLSATASAMRHRLRSVMHPGKRHSGALIVGAVFFLLCMTSGHVALAYDGASGAQMLYQCEDHSGYTIRSVSIHEDKFQTKFEIRDEDAFHSYLAGLTFYTLSGDYSFSDSQRYYFFIMDTPGGAQVFSLFDDVVKVVWLNQTDRPAEYYYVPGGLDWAYIDSIIVPQPAMNVLLFEERSSYGDKVSAKADKLWKTENGIRTLVYESEYPAEYHSGIFGREPFPVKAEFHFSQEPAGPYTVIVENWDRSSSYTVSQEELADGMTMDLPPYPAHYRICAAFRYPDGTLYEAEFCFDIGLMDNG